MRQPHIVSIEMVNTDWLRRIEAGSHIVFATRCVCSAGCDLSGSSIIVTLGSHDTVSHTLSGFNAATRGMDVNNILVAAPKSVGETSSSMRFPAREINGILHAESVATFALVTTPVKTSMTLWDVPRPIVTGQRFRLQAGLKSARGSSMAGATISVFDADESLVCRKEVEPHPMINTDALYRAAIDLVAPAATGTFTWTVKSDVSAIALAHSGSSVDLLLIVVDPPRHKLQVSLTDENGSGVADTLLRLGPYQQVSDSAGCAEFFVAGGIYLLQSWNPDYELISTELTVSTDAAHAFTIRAIPRADIEFL